MNPERYKRVDQVLQQALGQPPESLDSFLQQACAGDEELRREVQSLIEHERQAASWPDSPESGAGLGRARPKLLEPPAPELEGRTLLHYRILERIGQGGMGVVYRAEDTHLRRTVAVKVLPPDKMLDPERKRRFIQEARAASALNHPNIVTIHDITSADGMDFMAMEYLAGKPLAELIAGKGLPIRDTLSYAVQMADALAAAHDAGIIHRDLKPSNVIVSEKGLVKVLDFGLAKLAHPITGGEESGQSSLTRSGLILGTAAYMAPEQAEGMKVDHRADIFAFGAVLYEMITGQRAFKGDSNISTLAAVLHEEPKPVGKVAGAVPAELERIIARCLKKEPERRFQHFGDVKVALEELREELARRPSWQQAIEERAPYPGLASFTEQDATLFFGREAEVTALWKRVLERRLVAVIGCSGAGKTSFLRAGLIPARPEGWAAVYATPGANPALALARALIPELAGDAEAVDGLLGGITELTHSGDTRKFVASAVRWRSHYPEAVVVFDQFEELFSLNPPETQARTAALIEELATQGDIHVVLSLRDDFLIRCSDYPPLASVFESLTPLAALKHDELRRALVEPARLHGYEFEDDALVEEIISAVEESRGSLPLLAFAVSRLWEKRDQERKILTREAYSEIGGVAGALAQHGEATLERIGPERQGVVREIFRNLVTSQGTRAIMDRDELLSVFPERPAAEEVLGLLVGARLLTTHQEAKEGETSHHRIEIVHESLVRAWPRLVRWQAQDEEGAVLRDQLRQAAHLWEEKGKPKDLLWTGSSFREYELWRERYPGTLTALEEEFGQSMTARARRRKRLGRAAMVAGLVVLAGIALIVGLSRQQAIRSVHLAETSARLAEASKLLALADLRLSDDPTEALALATASLEEADTKQARAFIMKALWEAPPAMEIIGATAGVRCPTFSPDGKWLAAPGHISEVRVWCEDGRTPLVLPGHEISGEGSNIAKWASNDLLVTGLNLFLAKRVHVWSMPDGQLLRTIELGRNTGWGVAPRRLLGEAWQGDSSEERLLLRSWPLPNGEAEQLDIVNPDKLGAAWSLFAPDGNAWLYAKGRDVYEHPLPGGTASDRLFARLGADLVFPGVDADRLVFTDKAGEIQVWRYRPGQARERRVVRQRDSSSLSRSVDKSERWIYDVDPEQKLRVRSVGAWPGSRSLDLRRNASWYASTVDLHPSGEWAVASTSAFGRLTLWPLRRPVPTVVDGYRGIVRPVVFSPNSRWLATFGDGELRLWPLPGGGVSEMRTFKLPPGEMWFPPTFDRAGRFLVTAPGSGHVLEVVPLDGRPPRQLRDPSPATDAQAWIVAASPSGRLVAGASMFGQGVKTIRIWNVETGEAKRFVLPATPDSPVGGSAGSGARTGYEFGINTLAFADESILYAAGDGGLWRWDLEKGTREIAVSAPPGSMFSAWFSEGARRVLIVQTPLGNFRLCQQVLIHDTRARTSQPLTAFLGESGAIDTSGAVVAVGGADGSVRVGRLTSNAPHLLVGHKGRIDGVAISPDLRWVATTGEDNTLRLWPMPDLSKPPLHTLPHDALVAKLRSLTNFRAVRDPSSPDGWKIEIGPFPGWAAVPDW